MKIIFSIAFFFIQISNLKSQTLLESLGFQTRRASKEIIEKDYFKLMEINTNELDSNSLSLYYMKKSSLSLYLCMDSSLYFLNRAISYNPKRVCNILLAINSNPKISNSDWFATDLEDFDEQAFFKGCRTKYYNHSVVLEKRDTSEIERLIMNRDQAERINSIVNWQIQDSLDEINRIFIDSLYMEARSLLFFNPFELDAFTLVLHHSTDCIWNIKWFKIWMEQISMYKDRLNVGAFLGEAFKRLYNTKFCLQNYSSEWENMLLFLKSTYPIESKAIFYLD